MNCRQRKKYKKKIYQAIIEDVALEISLSALWRKRLFDAQYEEEFIISYSNSDELPKYVKNAIVDHKLEFGVMKVKNCPEYFDEGLVIFKFYPLEYPKLKRFSGNNLNVI